MKVVAIVQARMGSTRLPGKVLCDVAGEPMLARVMNRLQRAETLDELIVATTVEPADNALVALCAERGWLVYRGSETDVLDRYYQAARARNAEVVVRITSDCPLIDPEVVDRVVGEFFSSGADYASNVAAPRTYPRGLDTEVISFAALERAWREDSNPAWREHVTAFVHKRPELFRTHDVRNEIDLSEFRWTVDTPEDLEFVRRIYASFGNDRFSWQEVLSLLEKHPDWCKINAQIPQKVV